VVSGCGIGVNTVRWRSVSVGALDTVLAAGAQEIPLIEAIRSRALAQAFRKASLRAERYGSVCTGSFLLGAAGLLSGGTRPPSGLWAPPLRGPDC
jgi:transcriptional regulator GlxA family with amidase domain